MEEGNACCFEWKKRFSKLEEKRNALRQAVKLLEHQTNKLQAENLQLKQAIEQEKVKTKLEEEAKEKESSQRKELQKENRSLTSELSSLREDVRLTNPDASPIQQLETRILEGEAEIRRLKLLLNKETKKWESEKKKLEEEKKRAAEAHNLLEIERSNVDKENKLCIIERKKAEEYKRGLEKLKLESSEAKVALIAEKTKADNVCKKLELECQKALKEKRRADNERARAEDTRKLFETERKKVMDEKEHANNLAEKLEIERQKREDLQKEMDRQLSTGNAKNYSYFQDNMFTRNLIIENDSVKLLKEKLKLEKKHVKHSKRLARLQETENELLRRELNLLKQEIIKFSRHLNLLGGNLSQSIKGIAGLAKMEQSTRLLDLNKNKDIGNIFQHDHKYPVENEMGRYCTSFESFNHTAKDVRRGCTQCVFQEVGGNHSCRASGTNSGLESTIRDSVRRKSQSPLACSTSASFSDRSFMGSQERCSHAVTATKSVEKKLKCRDVDISGEFSELKSDRCPCLLDEKFDAKHADEKAPCNLWLTLYNENETLESNHRKKRRKIENTLQSVACLCSKDKNLHSKIEEKLGIVGGLVFHKKSFPTFFCCHTKEPSKSLDKRYTHSENSTKSDKNSYHFSKKKESKKQNLNLPFQGQSSDQGVNLQNIENIGAGFHSEHVQIKCQDTGKEVNSLVEDDAVHLFSNHKNEFNFPYSKDKHHADLMKLLELDDDSVEEKFRLAMARPLSPTLPILKPCGLPTLQVNSSHWDRSFLGGKTKDGNGVLTVACMADVLDDGEVTTEGRNFDNITEADQALACKGSISCAFSESVKEEIVSSGRKEVSGACVIPNGLSKHRTSLHFVTSSNSKNEESMSRAFHVMNMLYSQSSMFLRSDNFVGNIVSAFAFYRDLKSEEKNSIVLSMLLDHFSGQVPAEVGSNFSGDTRLVSFGAEMRAVMSNSETRTEFFDICKIELLLTLIKDFLIHREIFVCDISNDQLVQGSLDDAGQCMENEKGNVSSKVATSNQLAAGIIILATICEAFNQIGFLWEVSYNILRTCCNDVPWVLTAIHGFAHVCGLRFFTLVENDLLAVTVKSIVVLLEMKHGSHPQSETATFPTFSHCKDCPFAQGAVSLAKLVDILLSKIDDFLSAPSKASSISSVYECPGGTAGILSFNSELCSNEHSIKSCMAKHEVVRRQTISVPHDTLHCFVDVVSLLELAACHMAWDWTYGNIILRLMEMLQFCSFAEFSSAVLVLIGKLGRMGVDAEGYEHSDVSDLRNRISALFDFYDPKGSNFLVQVAIFGALIDLIPLSFEDIVGGNHIITQGSCSYDKSILNWFTRLSREQKLLLSSLFEHTDLQKE